LKKKITKLKKKKKHMSTSSEVWKPMTSARAMGGTKKTNKQKQKKQTQTKANKPHESAKPIMIGFVYADWCGHCQNFKPVWQQLKQKFDYPGSMYSMEAIDSAKLPGSLDAVRQRYHATIDDPQGYPHIFRVQRGGTAEVYSGGERTFANMSKWIKASASRANGTTLRRLNRGGGQSSVVVEPDTIGVTSTTTTGDQNIEEGRKKRKTQRRCDSKKSSSFSIFSRWFRK